MKCKDAQKKLPAYAEGIATPEEVILIEEHLKSCPKCNESLADLRKTIDYVHGLEDIEPPAWLTQKVMAKIKSEVQPKKGIIQKLFYPLHIKLPLEAAVTALIAVITIYIFKTMPPEMKLAQAPSERGIVTESVPSRAHKETTSTEKIALPLARDERQQSLPSSPTLEAEQSMPAKKPMVADKLEEAPQAPAQVLEQNEVRPSAGAVAKEEAKPEALSRSAKAKVPDEKREVLNVTVVVKDLKTARAEIKAALIHLGGKIIKTESLENKEIVTAEMDSQEYKEFIARLKSIGDVEEKEIDLKARDGTSELIIEIK